MKTISLRSQLSTVLAIALLGPCFFCQGGTCQEVREYQVKAAFLHNFAKFVKWPDDAFSGPESPVVIGIIGNDPFGKDLDTLVKDKTIRGRKVEIKRFQSAPPVCCQVLFIGQASKQSWPLARDVLKDCPALTVSDKADFLEQGGIIQFVNEYNKIRFAINVEASKKAGLHISSKLLNLATIVGGTDEEEP